MSESFDAYRYIGYLQSRWRWIAGSCAVAVAIAFVFSVVQTPQYTATARIVIESPAGTDLRSAMAVSPIYLESLRTYEQFATSDSLFQKAAERFHLRSMLGARPLESMKKRVLKVALVRNTRIMEIAATLPKAQTAQALANFLAESTVTINRSLVHEGDQDLIQNIQQQERQLRAELDRTENEWARLLSTEPVQDLQSATENAAELRSKIQQDILSAELEAADSTQREKQASAAQLAQIRADAAASRGRADEMRKQLQTLDRQAAEREKLLALRIAHRDRLEAERRAAQTALTAINVRLREALGDAGYRGERLKIIDPGIVPERPSSPNLPLNVAAALLLGLVLPILYLTLEMSFQEQRSTERRSVYHALAEARDE